MSNLVKIKNNKVVVSSRDIADSFEKRHDHILRDLDELKEGVTQKWGDLYSEVEYTHPQNKQKYREVIMNRDGFTLLAMGFTGKKALEWKLKYINAFNEMEEKILNNHLIPNNLSPQLQLLINIELEQKEMKQEIQDMREVISLDTTSWRNDSKDLIVKIANSLGGNEYIREVRSESYKLLNTRMGVSLETRLTNKRRRMADEGISKSQRDKLNNLDVIAEDKKLIEGYVAIIKEMSIKYGIA